MIVDCLAVLRRIVEPGFTLRFPAWVDTGTFHLLSPFSGVLLAVNCILVLLVKPVVKCMRFSAWTLGCYPDCSHVHILYWIVKFLTQVNPDEQVLP